MFKELNYIFLKNRFLYFNSCSDLQKKGQINTNHYYHPLLKILLKNVRVFI